MRFVPRTLQGAQGFCGALHQTTDRILARRRRDVCCRRPQFYHEAASISSIRRHSARYGCPLARGRPQEERTLPLVPRRQRVRRTADQRPRAPPYPRCQIPLPRSGRGSSGPRILPSSGLCTHTPEIAAAEPGVACATRSLKGRIGPNTTSPPNFSGLPLSAIVVHPQKRGACRRRLLRVGYSLSSMGCNSFHPSSHRSKHRRRPRLCSHSRTSIRHSNRIVH